MQFELFNEEEGTSIDEIITNESFEKITSIIKTTGSCIIGLSGGNTPKDYYEMLNKVLMDSDLIKDIHLIQVDERWVELEDERSNQKMLQSKFDPSFNTCFIPPKNQINSEELAAQRYSDELQLLLDELDKNSIDLLILGMGEDGHTASLFPYNDKFVDALDEKLDQLAFATYVDQQSETRITIAPKVISNAHQKFLLIKGTGKGITFKNIEFSDSLVQYPIKLAIDQNLTVFMDKSCYNSYIR